MMITIFDAVIRSPFEMLDHARPLRPLQSVQSKEHGVLGNTPTREFQARLEMVEVSLAALFSSSTGNGC